MLSRSLRAPTPRRFVHALLCLVLLALMPLASGCRPQLRVADIDTELAAEQARKLEQWLVKHPDDARARLELAELYWMHLGEIERATEALDVLTALDPAPPLARFSRALIAEHRLDGDRAWTEYTALIAEVTDHESAKLRTQAAALSTRAAIGLDTLEGLGSDDADRFVALYDGLDLDALPAATAELLLSTRASIARRREQDYRPFYARQGCVQDWVVGELEGYRGALELSRREVDRSFRLDGEATLTALSCAVRVWNADPGASIRRLRTTVELPADQSRMRLTLGAQTEARAYVDDQLVWASDRSDRYPVTNPTFELNVGPGLHRLEVRTAIPSERAWLLVRATDGEGQPLKVSAASEGKGDWRLPLTGEGRERAEAPLERVDWNNPRVGLRGPTLAPLRAYLSLADAISTGDSDRAETEVAALRAEAEGFPDAHLLLADFEYQDPTRGRTSSAARQQAELEAALDSDPTLARARLSLLSMRLDRGDVAEVIEELEQLPEQGVAAAETLMFSLLRYDAYRRRGSELLAERALEQAEAANPRSCEALMARRELVRERIQVKAEDALVEALRECPGSLGIRARWALTRENYDEARQLWTEQLARIPDDIDAMEALANIAVAEGRYEDAAKWQREIFALAPFRALSLIELADLMAQSGENAEARELVAEAIATYPHNSRLREIGERVGIRDELLDWRIDGAKALAEYRADVESGAAAEAEGVSEVLLLDREVSIVYEDGGHRHIVHQMFHILSDQAIDAHGEFNQPGVRLLSMHSIKPDGTIVEPESIAGKEGLSLRGLAIDDVVEIEFMFDTGPDPALPGHVDLGRFRFQSPELPFHRSELIALVPEAIESKVRIEARNAAPEPTRRVVELGEGRFGELTFRARAVPRLGTEPGARSMLDELPMIQLHVPLVVVDWLDQLANQLRPAQRSNPELRTLARELTADYTSAYDKVDMLWRWVVDEIEEGGDLTTPATATLAARRGSRLMLLRALCEAAGIDNQLWLLRDRFGPTIYEDGNPLVESYDTAMLAVTMAKGPPLIVGTSSEVVPLGYLSPSYAKGRALRVRLENDEPEPGYAAVPANPDRYADTRRWDIEVSLDAAGNGRLQGSIELGGIEAISWRDVFDKIDQDRLPEVFTQAELGRVLPGASLDLEALEFDNEWELSEPLIIRFAARVRDAGVVQGNQLILLAAAVPVDLATGYTRLPRRWSGMVVPYAPVLEARVRYVLGGASFSEVPADLALTDVRGNYTRRISAGGVGEREVVIESRSTLESGIVEAQDYGALAQYAGQVQVAEQQLLRATIGPVR